MIVRQVEERLLGQALFELGNIDVTQGTTEGRFTGYPTPRWVKGRDQDGGVMLDLLCNGGNGLLLAENRRSNDA